MSTEQKKPKGILGPFEKIGLILCLAVLAYLAFQRGGFKMAERTEKVVILDDPHAEYKNRKSREYKAPLADPAVDQVLERIAERFSQQPVGDTKKELKKMGLSSDEAEYYSDIKEQHQLDQTLQSAQDWYRLLRTSQQTYGKVKSLFESIDQSAVEKQKVDGVLDDEAQAGQLYDKMRDWFDIPESEVRAFARQGRQTVSEWAEFVEENKKKQPW